jgi:hypothetical protein
LIGVVLPLENKDPKPPNKIILFCGHMIDAPGRQRPRFPADKEPIAARAIASVLNEFGIGHGDLCICGGACGGDLLFAEAALIRGALVELYIPFDEETFLKESVEFAGSNWRERFLAVKSRATLRVLPVERKTASNVNPYEQNGLWMLEAAERFGADKVDFICLWNGQQLGDGPGSKPHLMEEVPKRGGRVHWLDTTKLWTDKRPPQV